MKIINLTKGMVLLTALTFNLSAFTSCESDEVALAPKNVLPADGVIRVETSVNDIRSLALGYTSDGPNEFGLFVTNSKNSTYTYGNVYMQKNDTTGEWASYEDNENGLAKLMLWQKADAPVTIVAYAPYVKGAALDKAVTGTVKEDQTTAENGLKSDLLYAKADVTPAAPDTIEDIFYDTEAKKLNVRLNHVMSKLTVNIRYGTELTQEGTPTPTSVSLGETKTGYSLNLADGTVTTTDSAGSIKMATADSVADGYTQSYEAILVPQNAAFEVAVLLNGLWYVYSHSGFGFKSGNAYTLNLVVGKDIVNLGGITAKPWENADPGSIETE